MKIPYILILIVGFCIYYFKPFSSFIANTDLVITIVVSLLGIGALKGFIAILKKRTRTYDDDDE